MSSVAIIPARIGSKGVPQKNIRLLDGKPLIEYSINSAKECDNIDEIIVSSDSDKVLELADKSMVKTHKRKNEFSSDTASMNSVLYSVISDLNLKCDIICLLQPTCPFRPVGLIDDCMDSFKQPKVDSVLTVSEVGDMHPARMYSITENRMTCFSPDNEMKNRQALPKVYHRNGLVYARRLNSFLKTGKLYDKDTVPVIVNERFIVNIDEPIDFLFSEFLKKSGYV